MLVLGSDIVQLFGQECFFILGVECNGDLQVVGCGYVIFWVVVVQCVGMLLCGVWQGEWKKIWVCVGIVGLGGNDNGGIIVDLGWWCVVVQLFCVLCRCLVKVGSLGRFGCQWCVWFSVCVVKLILLVLSCLLLIVSQCWVRCCWVCDRFVLLCVRVCQVFRYVFVVIIWFLCRWFLKQVWLVGSSCLVVVCMCIFCGVRVCVLCSVLQVLWFGGVRKLLCVLVFLMCCSSVIRLCLCCVCGVVGVCSVCCVCWVCLIFWCVLVSVCFDVFSVWVEVSVCLVVLKWKLLVRCVVCCRWVLVMCCSFWCVVVLFGVVVSIVWKVVIVVFRCFWCSVVWLLCRCCFSVMFSVFLVVGRFIWLVLKLCVWCMVVVVVVIFFCMVFVCVCCSRFDRVFLCFFRVCIWVGISISICWQSGNVLFGLLFRCCVCNVVVVCVSRFFMLVCVMCCWCSCWVILLILCCGICSVCVSVSVVLVVLMLFCVSVLWVCCIVV